MKKQFRVILEKSELKVKWKNIYHWQDEQVDNLYKAVKNIGIKITGTTKKIKIELRGSIEIQRNTNLAYLEKDCFLVIKLFYISLGDKTKIKSRFGNFQLNYKF